MTNRELLEGRKSAHTDLEPGLLSKLSIGSKRKAFMDHGNSIMYDPNHPCRFPSSRDWNMPDIDCKRKTCAANYKLKCVMPSLIKIGANGKCLGCHDRKSRKKKK